MNNIHIDSFFIDGFRTFDKFIVYIDKSRNIFIGPNGVGKSTILKLLFRTFEGTYELGKEFEEEKYSYGIGFSSKRITNKFFNELKMSNLSVKINLSPAEEPFLKIHEYYETDNPPQPEYIKLSPQKLRGKTVRIFYYYSNKLRTTPRLILEFFYLIDNVLYGQTYVGNSVPQLIERGCLNFNYSDYKKAFRKVVESKKQMKNIYNQFRKKSTSTFNQLTGSSDQSFELTGDPNLKIIVKDSNNMDIEKLSSGQNQLENLKLFVKAVQAVNPSLVHLDEPEIHLNYGQQFYLQDFLSALTQEGRQVFISTHSTLFVQSSSLNFIRYLKLNEAGNAEVCNIPSRENKFLINYPQLFYANNIILVEGLADKIFFERALNIILKDKYSLDLSSLNTEVIAVYGKDKINRLARIIQNDLKLNQLMIVDQDFILRDANYTFVSDYARKEINRLLQGIISENKLSSARMFKKMSQSLAKEFIDFLDKAFSSDNISKETQNRYSDYRKSFQSNSGSFSKKDLHVLKTVKQIFACESVWMLEEGTIEMYVSNTLIKRKKLDIEKLQDVFYPINITDLRTYLKPGSLRELHQIANYIKSNFGTSSSI